jgi:hypothetical protein
MKKLERAKASASLKTLSNRLQVVLAMNHQHYLVRRKTSKGVYLTEITLPKEKQKLPASPPPLWFQGSWSEKSH